MQSLEPIYENFNSNSTLIVTFQAHADKIFGTSVQEFRGTLNSLASRGYDTLKVNDTNGYFFFQGIDSERNSFEKTLAMLSQYMKNYERTIFMGNCAGGYAAVLFGTMLDVDMVIGINTVTYLDQASLIEAGDGRESQAMFLDQEIPYLNLRNHLKNIKYNTQIYSIVDQNTPRHVKQSQNISESPNVTIEYIDSPIPQIGFHLLRNGELIDKIISKINPKDGGSGFEGIK